MSAEGSMDGSKKREAEHGSSPDGTKGQSDAEEDEAPSKPASAESAHSANSEQSDAGRTRR